MRWFRIDNTMRVQPTEGIWSDWKGVIATACKNQCVYCAIHESKYGGLDNFHVEHYRPKSRFANLLNEITNLYLTCAICNRFKGNDWPRNPRKSLNACCYPDPGAFDFETIFERDQSNHVVVGLNVATRYVTERLYLNRPQLIRQRRWWAVRQEIRTRVQEVLGLYNQLKQHMDDPKVSAFLTEMVPALGGLTLSSMDAADSSPSSADEVRRPSKPPLKGKKKAP